MTACAHRWITAVGERRDTCGECGVHAADVIATLTQRLAAAERERGECALRWTKVYGAACRDRDRLQADLQRVRGALEFALQRCIDNGFEHGDLANTIRAALTGPATGEGTK